MIPDVNNCPFKDVFVSMETVHPICLTQRALSSFAIENHRETVIFFGLRASTHNSQYIIVWPYVYDTIVEDIVQFKQTKLQTYSHDHVTLKFQCAPYYT